MQVFVSGKVFLDEVFVSTCQGACVYSDSRIYNSSRLLVKLGEHTWGLPSAGDTLHWSNPQLAEVIHSEFEQMI